MTHTEIQTYYFESQPQHEDWWNLCIPEPNHLSPRKKDRYVLEVLDAVAERIERERPNLFVKRANRGVPVRLQYQHADFSV